MVYAACAVLALLGIGLYAASIVRSRESPADGMIVGAAFAAIAVMAVTFGLTLQAVGSLDRTAGVAATADRPSPHARAASM